MDKKILTEKVKKGDYNKGQLLAWIATLPGSSGSAKPSSLKVGDVFMHPVFKHPYVFLENKGDFWLCGLLTSNCDFEQTLCSCRSRFFGTSHFTKVLFTVSEPIGSWCNVYDNTRHLKSVLKQLKEIML
jgi:hypothetical protein